MAPDGLSPVVAAMFVMAVFALSVALLSHIQGIASWILQTYTGERLVLEFRSEVFAHVQRLSLGYRDEHRRLARRYVIDRARGHVRFEGVGFGYRADEPILRDVSFNIPAGTRVGVVGTTGSGKTTLITLLSRFYDPDHGRILLDGVDLRDYKLDDLRRQFGLVLQDAVLFAGSIAENIAYARPSASRGEVIAAAKADSAHDFIGGLPEGYETKVGERGMLLSGGQRQRISIARAFLKDSPVLIMDEPTSAVDLRTEAGIMESMESLMHGRTMFMIAYRLNTLEHCDLLLVWIGAARASKPGCANSCASPPAT